METSMNVYWRKSNRHHWNCIAICRDNKRELVRQIFHAQKDAPDWQIGFTEEEYNGRYPENKKTQYPMTLSPEVIDTNTINALEDYFNLGMTPKSMMILEKFTILGLE